LQRLKDQGLVAMSAAGRHRYYSLGGPEVAAALEALSVLAGGRGQPFAPTTPNRLRAARTCYDHIAGALGVSLHDRFNALGWLTTSPAGETGYDLTPEGAKGFKAFGIDLDGATRLGRRLAYACVDWSERRPHVAGALGAAVLSLALHRKWIVQDLDSRALEITATGRRELKSRLGLTVVR
jgi:hypothetical protein